MAKKIFFLVALFFIIGIAFATTSKPTLTSISISPNPAFVGETITVNTVGNDLNISLDANNNGNVSNAVLTADGNWNCQSFKSEKAGIFSDFWFLKYWDSSVPIDQGQYGAIKQARIFSWLDQNTIGSTLSSFSGDTNGTDKGASRETSCHYISIPLDTNFSVTADTNYWFCFQPKTTATSGSGSSTFKYCGSAGDNGYSKGKTFSNVSKSTLNSGDNLWAYHSTTAQQTNWELDSDFNLFLQIQKNVRAIAIKSGGDFNSNYLGISNFTSQNPSVSFINPFSTYSNVISVKLQNTDGNYSVDKKVSLITIEPLSNFLQCNPISNINSCIVDYNQVNIILTNPNSESKFELISSNSTSAQVPIFIQNALTDDKRYFVYTADSSDYASGIWNFSNTLTYGSTAYNGMQKVWDSINLRFNHSFSEALSPVETKFYLLKYQSPFKSWSSLSPNSQNDWDISFVPTSSIEFGHSKDLFNVSTYNEIRNQYKTTLPSITSNTSGSPFFQLVFNARTDQSTTIQGGRKLNGLDTTSSATVSANETTLNFSTGADYPLIKTSSSSNAVIELSDYSILEKGYFTKPIEIRDFSGNDLETVLVSGSNTKILREGQNFKVQSQLYNKDGDLDYVEGKVYFYATNDANRVAYFKTDFNNLALGEIYNIDWSIPGIVDTSSSTSYRPIIVSLRAVNDQNNYYEIQTAGIQLRQFPSDPGDFLINIDTINKKVASHPKVFFTIRNTAPETLRGINLYIYSSTHSITNNDYNRTFWKDTDFSCIGFNCSFNQEISDFVYNTSGQ